MFVNFKSSFRSLDRVKLDSDDSKQQPTNDKPLSKRAPSESLLGSLLNLGPVSCLEGVKLGTSDLM